MDDIERKGLFSTFNTTTHGIFLLATLFFYNVSGCLNYFIKRLVNLSLYTEDILVLASSINVLYNATNLLFAL
jgi:hypothetical protein